MFGHLTASEFVDVLDGVEVGPKRRRHLETCTECGDTLGTLAELHEDVASTDAALPDEEMAGEMARVDWNELRSSVRDGLLARSVERSSRLGRWTGTAMRPAPAWSLGIALVISAMSLGGFWHYRTAHGETPAPRTSLTETEAAFSEGTLLFEELEGALDEVTAVAAESLGWIGNDLFTDLDQLESSEEDLLRELITEAAGEYTGYDNGVLQ